LRKLRRHYGRALYRILYRRSGKLFILLQMIRRGPGGGDVEIEIAKRRWRDFKQRMEML
jgi:phage-related protein